MYGISLNNICKQSLFVKIGQLLWWIFILFYKITPYKIFNQIVWCFVRKIKLIASHLRPSLDQSWKAAWLLQPFSSFPTLVWISFYRIMNILRICWFQDKSFYRLASFQYKIWHKIVRQISYLTVLNCRKTSNSSKCRWRLVEKI